MVKCLETEEPVAVASFSVIIGDAAANIDLKIRKLPSGQTTCWSERQNPLGKCSDAAPKTQSYKMSEQTLSLSLTEVHYFGIVYLLFAMYILVCSSLHI